MFSYLCLLVSLCCSFGSLCVSSWPPSTTAYGSTPVQLSPTSPVGENDRIHSTCKFVMFVCDAFFSFCTCNLQSRLEKCVFLVYGAFLEALFAIMCSAACIPGDIFIFSPCLRHHFADKWTLLSEVTSHKYVRLTLPARCRIHVAMMSTTWIHGIH